jgi:hypothetical protein
LLWSPGVKAGVKLASMKFVQRVILVQTRGVSDPRVVCHLPSMRTLFLKSLVNFNSCKTKMTQTFPTAQVTTRSLIPPSWKPRDKSCWMTYSICSIAASK